MRLFLVCAVGSPSLQFGGGAIYILGPRTNPIAPIGWQGLAVKGLSLTVVDPVS